MSIHTSTTTWPRNACGCACAARRCVAAARWQPDSLAAHRLGRRRGAGPAGEITPAAPQRVLSTRLSPQTNPVTLLVDVDGYPRSFAFRLETDATAVDVPQAELVAIKLTSPAAATAYRLPSPPIAIRLQADVPSDDLSGSDDFIEVGLDTNRDRLLADEPTVRLVADRQTSVTLEKLNPGGTLTVLTEVRDLAVEIPTSSVASGRVGCWVESPWPAKVCGAARSS